MAPFGVALAGVCQRDDAVGAEVAEEQVIVFAGELPFPG